MNCVNQVKFCKSKFCPCDFCGREEECPLHKVDCGGESVPTLAQWRMVFAESVARYHAKTGKLDAPLVRHILSELEQFKTAMGFTDEDRLSVINRKSLAAYCEKLTCKGVTKIGKCNSIRQMFARWIRREVEEAWEIPLVELPDIVNDSDRFHEPTMALRLAIAKWYRGLIGKGRGKFMNRDRLFAMMMYKYAMRNGDVARLTWANFQRVGERMRLVYTPHKTRLTSGRVVKVWMDPMDASDLMEYRNGAADEAFVFGGGKCSEVCKRLNGQLRALGVEGSKGMYILRKLCIHAIFKSHGNNAAEAISGDNFNTIKNHYADTDAVNVTALSDDAYFA